MSPITMIAQRFVTSFPETIASVGDSSDHILGRGRRTREAPTGIREQSDHFQSAESDGKWAVVQFRKSTGVK